MKKAFLISLFLIALVSQSKSQQFVEGVDMLFLKARGYAFTKDNILRIESFTNFLSPNFFYQNNYWNSKDDNFNAGYELGLSVGNRKTNAVGEDEKYLITKHRNNSGFILIKSLATFSNNIRYTSIFGKKKLNNVVLSAGPVLCFYQISRGFLIRGVSVIPEIKFAYHFRKIQMHFEIYPYKMKKYFYTVNGKHVKNTISLWNFGLSFPIAD